MKTFLTLSALGFSLFSTAALAQSGGADYSNKQCEAVIGAYKYRVYPYGSAGLNYAVQIWTIATGQKYGEYVLKRSTATTDQGAVFTGSGLTYYRSLQGSSQRIKDAQNGGSYIGCRR